MCHLVVNQMMDFLNINLLTLCLGIKFQDKRKNLQEVKL